MRILFSHYGFLDGSGFSRSYLLAINLASLGHEVTLITTQKLNFKLPYIVQYRDGIKIIAVPDFIPISIINTGFGILTPIIKTFIILKSNYDIVHADAGHRLNSGLPCIVYKMFKSCVYITEWWDYFGRGGLFERRKIIKKLTIGIWDLIFEVCSKRVADGVVALSSYTYVRALRCNISSERLIVIRGGCDTKRIPYYPSNDALKEKYNIPSVSLVLGFIGITDGEIDDLLPLFSALKIVPNNINVKLLTTGGKINQKLVTQYGLQKYLIEYGWLDYEIFAEVIGCVDIFILLQRNGRQEKARWPNKIGDYFSAGRIVLTNPVGEIRYLIKDYKDFFFVCYRNKTSIYNSIIHLYNERQSYMSIRPKIRRVAEEKLSWLNAATKLEQFYIKICKNNKYDKFQ